MRCLSHEDKNPSASIVRPEDDDGFVYCHTCGWSVDAAGLEAAFSGRPVADVLREWASGDRWKPTITRESPYRMRYRLWLEWVEMTQFYIDLMRSAEPDPDLRVVALDQLAAVFEDIARAVADDELAPAQLGRMLAQSEGKMQSWLHRWIRK